MKAELVSIYPLAFRVEAETFYEKRILHHIVEAGRDTIHFKETKESSDQLFTGRSDEMNSVVIYAEHKKVEPKNE